MAGKKYKNQQVFWDVREQAVVSPYIINKYRYGNSLKLPRHIIRFPSKHEFKVYLELLRMYGIHRVVSQYGVKISPPNKCYPKGRLWKVDFAIMSVTKQSKPQFIVEAKGLMTTDFKSALFCLEMHNPRYFDKLYIVFTDKIPTERHIIKNLLHSDFKNHIMTLDQLRELKELS